MGARSQETLLERLARTVAGAHEDALLLTGPPGSGKSHLLRTAAAASPRPVVVAHINPLEGMWALSGLSSLLSALDPRAVEFSGRFAVRSLEPAALQAAAADVLALLRGLRLAPTAVFVDDIDRMDGVSRTLLGFMAGRLAGTGIRLVGAARRVRPQDPLTGFPRVRVPPLSPAEALELALASGAGGGLDEGTAQLVVAHTAGNPGALLAALAGLTAEQRGGRESIRFPLPADPAGREIAHAALDSLDAESLRLVSALALAPLAHPSALVAAGLTTEDALDDLVRSGLVEERDPYVRLRNPLVRAAAHAGSPARSRRRVHGDLAAASRPVAPALAAWHASFAAREGRDGAALVTGAVELLEAGEVTAAGELADRALRHRFEPPSVPSVLDIAARLGRRGEWALACRYLARVGREDLDHAGRARVAFAVLAAHLGRSGRIPLASLAAAVELYGDTEPSGAVALVARAALPHALLGDADAAGETLEVARRLRDRVDGDGLRLHDAVADLVAAVSPGGRRPPPAPAPAHDAVHASAPELVARARAASFREDYAGAAMLYSLVGESPADEDAVWHDAARLLAIENAMRSGRLDEAVDALLRLRSERLGPTLEPFRALADAWAEALLGRVAEGRARLAEWIGSRRAAEGAELAVAHVLAGQLALLEGEAATAVREFSHAELAGAGIGDPGVLRYHPALIDALLATGRTEAARATLAHLEVAVARHPGRWAELARARARAALADDAAALEIVERALDAAGTTDSPLERAFLLARKARALRGRHPLDSEAALLEARAALELAGAAVWSRVLDPAERPGAVVDNPLLELLSPPEREVAALVREGLHNKEIAARLFVSLRTVELRLTTIYRKTGLPSRSHLVAALS